MAISVAPGPTGEKTFRAIAIALTLATFLTIGTAGGKGFAPSSLPEFVVWFLAPGVFGAIAGARRDPTMAALTYLSGIVGATAVAWIAGPVGVAPGADPGMRSSYYAMLVVIAAGVSAVIGFIVVVAGYRLGRRLVATPDRV